MIKNDFKPVSRLLDTGSSVSIVPSIGDSIDSLVFKYINADLELVLHFDAKHGKRLLEIYDSNDIQKLVEKAIYYSKQSK